MTKHDEICSTWSLGFSFWCCFFALSSVLGYVCGKVVLVARDMLVAAMWRECWFWSNSINSDPLNFESPLSLNQSQMNINFRQFWFSITIDVFHGDYDLYFSSCFVMHIFMLMCSCQVYNARQVYINIITLITQFDNSSNKKYQIIITRFKDSTRESVVHLYHNLLPNTSFKVLTTYNLA